MASEGTVAKSFADAAGRTGVVVLQTSGAVCEQPDRRLDVDGLIGAPRDRLHDSYKIWLRQVGNSLRRQVRPQHREASRSRDRFPLADQFREDTVELMHQQGLESCALAAQAMVFPPGPPQLPTTGTSSRPATTRFFCSTIAATVWRRSCVSGNVHSADDWDELLVPEIERQRAQGQRVAFRADTAFAKPEIDEELETRCARRARRRLGR